MEYRNSKGLLFNEECLTCEHQQLCFWVLEYAGMVIKPGDKIRFDCEQIKENPEHYRKMVGRKCFDES